MALLMVLYFLIRRAIREFKVRQLTDNGTTADPDQMVEDPVCHTFVPRRIALIKTIGGKSYCFCSHQCATAFLERQGG